MYIYHVNGQYGNISCLDQFKPGHLLSTFHLFI